MTEKNLSIAAPRCAFNVWKYVHWGNAHRTNQQTNQPTLQRPVYGGSRLRKFPPLSQHRRLHTASCYPSLRPSTSSCLRIPSDLFSCVALGLSFTFHRRRQRLRVSAPISPSTESFSRFFSPRVYPTPETTPDGGGGGGRRPEGAAVGIETQPRQFSYRTT